MNLNDKAWMLRGNCLNMHPDVFFPGGHPAAIKAAKLICVDCPVLAQCAAWACDHGEWRGVWAGASETQRRGWRTKLPTTRRNVQPCGTDAAYRRHYQHNEKPCPECVQAHNLAVRTHERARRAKKKEAA